MKSVILAAVATATLSVAAASAQNAPATSSAGGAFIDKQTEGEFRAPKLIGVSVYDNANKSVGKISDLLLDKDGTVKAVVIGVGGFLGIGAKDVAVPYSALHWQTEQRTVATSGAAPANPAMGNKNAVNGNATGMSGGANGMSGNAVDGVGASPATGTAATGDERANLASKPVPNASTDANDQTRAAKIDPAKTEAYQGYPDRAVIDMSQEQLKSAPEFKYASNPASDTMGGGMGGNATDNAQKP